MPHEKSSSSYTGGAVTTVPRRAPDGGAAITPVERRTSVDPRTRAQTVYQRGPDGSEMYASYYTSNDDPEFQRRHNKDGSGTTMMQSVQVSYVSNGGGFSQQQQQHQHHQSRHRHTSAASPTVVEEAEETDAKPIHDCDLGDEQYDDAHSSTAGRTRAARPTKTATRQPVVEEPDDDDDSDGNGATQRGAHRATSGQHQRRTTHHNRGSDAHDTGRAQRGTYAPFTAPGAFGGDPMMPSMMFPSIGFSTPDPFSRGPAMGGLQPHGFVGPDSPFRMMEMMQQRMQQQRAAMFGGMDPFASFF